MVLDLQASTVEEAEGWHELLESFIGGNGEASGVPMVYYIPHEGSFEFRSSAAVDHTHLVQLSTDSTTKQVCMWLESIGVVYCEYVAQFAESAIDGAMLLAADFGAGDLEELGVRVGIHRKKILKELEQAKILDQELRQPRGFAALRDSQEWNTNAYEHHPTIPLHHPGDADGGGEDGGYGLDEDGYDGVLSF
jgi:hypothetical protein